MAGNGITFSDGINVDTFNHMMNWFHIHAKTLSGKDFDFESLRGNPTLLVNIASRCGFAPQLADLQKLHDTYGSKGLKILAFPSDDFKQEPLKGEEIGEFCQVNYGLSFQVMEKAHVRGKERHPAFRIASGFTRNGLYAPAPLWNFQKYLIDGEGRLADFFLPFTSPSAPRVTGKIEKLLREK